MKVLIPIKSKTDLYHDNPVRAPYFALYKIDNIGSFFVYMLEDIIENPQLLPNNNEDAFINNHGICDQKHCSKEHVDAHYNLTEKLHGCDYILIDHYCKTVTNVFETVGVKTYKLSPFLQTTDIAIKNFLLGASLASTLQHIHARA